MVLGFETLNVGLPWIYHVFGSGIRHGRREVEVRSAPVVATCTALVWVVPFEQFEGQCAFRRMLRMPLSAASQRSGRQKTRKNTFGSGIRDPRSEILRIGIEVMRTDRSRRRKQQLTVRLAHRTSHTHNYLDRQRYQPTKKTVKSEELTV